MTATSKLEFDVREPAFGMSSSTSTYVPIGRVRGAYLATFAFGAPSSADQFQTSLLR
jgi:hypothetical protein